MSGHSLRDLTDVQKALLERLLSIGWAMAGDASPDVKQSVADRFEEIFAASEVIDDIQDGLHPADPQRILDALEYLISGLRGVPAGSLACVLDQIEQAIDGQRTDLSVKIGNDGLSREAIGAHCDDVARRKIGSLFVLAFALPWYASSRTTGPPPEELVELGARTGVAVQSMNDLNGLTSDKVEDFYHGRVTRIWEWVAGKVDPGEFEALRRQAAAAIKDTQAAESMQARLRELIDVRACVRQVRERFASDVQALANRGLPVPCESLVRAATGQ